MSDLTEEQVEQLQQEAKAAGLELAKSFSQWYEKSQLPEEQLDMQVLSDAWDLLMFRREKYDEAVDLLTEHGIGGCADCPDEHDHSKDVTDA